MKAPAGHGIKNRRALLEGLCFLTLSLALLWHALDSHHRGIPVGWELSPSLFPLLCAAFLLVLSLALIREGFSMAPGEAPAPLRWHPVLVTALAALAYALLLPLLGFVLATVCFLAGMLIYLGERRPLLLILLPLCFSAGSYLLFARLLHVMLPAAPLDVLRRGLDLLL